MRALIQRVTYARVRVDGQVVAEIGPGLLVLLGVGRGDTSVVARWVAHKTANLRIFSDEAGKMNLSVRQTGGAALVVSQFTLYGDIGSGFRPSFTAAALPDVAEPLVRDFVAALEEEGVPTATGVFGAHMEVELLNDGPVTVLIEKEERG